MVWSLEILPKYLDKVHVLPQFVKEVYIASIPGTDNQELVTASKVLIEQGKTPVPHICARNLGSEEEFNNLIAQLKDIGVDRVLLLSGGADHSIGPYFSVMDLFNSGLLAKHGISRIDIAGHPEGNPNDPNADFNILEKIEWATMNNINVRIVTQWSLNPEKINSWISKIRKFGVKVPIHIGIAGPAKTKTILNYAKICGVNVSLLMLKKQGFNILKMFILNKPDLLVDQIKGHDQFHVFPFGGLAKASKWLTDININSLRA